MSSPRVGAVVVNHNSSVFTELAVRSLYSMHESSSLDVQVTVMDNASQDDTSELQDFAEVAHLEFRQSGHDSATQQANSHGEVLRQFIMDKPDCDYYLLLDSDICFVMPETVDRMVREIESRDRIWAIQASLPRSTKHLFRRQQHLLTQVESEENQRAWRSRANLCHHTIAKRVQDRAVGVVEPPRANPYPLQREDLERPTIITRYLSNRSRCDPCCTVVRNTATVRRVADRIGLSGALIAADFVENAGSYDTMGLMTEVMNTHEESYLVSSCGVLHFWKVAYGLGDSYMEVKRDQAARLLDSFRRNDVPDFNGESWMTPAYLEFLEERWGYERDMR